MKLSSDNKVELPFYSQKKTRQRGFSLFELMIAMVIIAILTAIAIPAYQSYIRKAAMTDMLQMSAPYRTAVELCFIEQGKLSTCEISKNGIPKEKTSQYVNAITVNAGKIQLKGANSLADLTVTLTPTQAEDSDGLIWNRTCDVANSNQDLKVLCEEMFKPSRRSE